MGEVLAVQSRSIDLPLPAAMGSLFDELEGRKLYRMSYLPIPSMLHSLRALLVYKTENALAIQSPVHNTKTRKHTSLSYDGILTGP